jgi:uroporphyrinogen decarboxylase
VQLFDSWASVLLQPFFDLWCMEPVKKIAARLKADHPHVPIIAFPRGAGLLYNGYRAATGVDAIGLDETVPLNWAADQASQYCVQGNLDPQMLVVGGDAMTRETQRILAVMAGKPHVFNLGHGISLHTPPEHVAALVTQVTRWQA